MKTLLLILISTQALASPIRTITVPKGTTNAQLSERISKLEQTVVIEEIGMVYDAYDPEAYDECMDQYDTSEQDCEDAGAL
jgi:DNA-binding Lrp family transcriptional regulator